MRDVIEIIGGTPEVAWQPWAVSYFFLIGLSIGAFALTLPHHVFGWRGWERIGRLGLVGALAAAIAAPVALLADLHQPGRFWHFYVFPNPRSWMAWGAFFIPVYLIGLVAYAWLALRPELAQAAQSPGPFARLYRLAGGRAHPRATRTAAAAAAVGAGLVLLYTGMEVMVVRARPIWNTPLLPVQFAVTAFAGGIGLLLLLDRLTEGHEQDAERRLSRLLAPTLAASLLIGIVWFALGAFGLDGTHAAALASVRDHAPFQAMAVWGVAAVMGAILLAWLRPVGTGWLAGAIALHAAWMLRWTVFIGGQTVPKTGPGFIDYELPFGPAGLLGIVGAMGLFVFLLVVMDTVLPSARRAGGADCPNARA